MNEPAAPSETVATDDPSSTVRGKPGSRGSDIRQEVEVAAESPPARP